MAWFSFILVSVLSTPAPVVLADEAAYLLTTLFGYSPTNTAAWGIVPQIPDVLYYWLYAWLPRADLYAAAKVLNAAFLVGAAVPAYLLARPYLEPRGAALFAVAVICAPICSFARYFMPECLYYFGFWWAMHALLVSARRPALRFAALSGACLGLLSLVKPHAAGLVLAAIAFFMIRPRPRTSRVAAALAVLVCWYVARTTLAYVLTGQLDWSVSGPTYGGVLRSGAFDLKAMIENLAGHLAGLVLLVGLPLAALVTALLRDRSRLSADASDLAVLALCILAALVAMTVYFSASLQHVDGPEAITRLHGRYYAYALPLVVLAFVVLLRSDVPDRLRSSRALLGFAACAVVSCCVLALGYHVTVIDYPELSLLLKWPKGLLVPAAAVVACLVAWKWRGRTGSRGMGGWMPVVWWSGIVVTTSVLLLLSPFEGKFFVSNDIDAVMLNDPAARSLVHRADGVVVGTHQQPADVYRVMFYLASLSRGLLVETGTVLSGPEFPGDRNWLILLPGVAYTGSGESTRLGPLTYVKRR